MKYRLISQYGNAMPLLESMAKTSDVEYWLHDGQVTSECPRIKDWSSDIDIASILLFDFTGMGKLIEEIEKSGYRCYGGGTLNDSITSGLGQHLTKLTGMKQYQRTFAEFNDAVEFVNNNKHWSFVQRENESHFTIQRDIEGECISVELYFIHGKPIRHTLNCRIGNAIRFWKKDEPKAFNIIFKPILSFLNRFHFSGAITCTVFVGAQDKLPYFVKWLPQFNPIGLEGFCEAVGNVSRFIESVVSQREVTKPNYEWHGKQSDSIKNLQKWKYV